MKYPDPIPEPDRQKADTVLFAITIPRGSKARDSLNPSHPQT
jgi:hypothetical protein